ncbi:MAG TPA: prolyl oligopeptidase family serine peptidase [Pirellulales bacterium]|jgi:pimeloyl-ACP methyl ester carboxylesterase|nr:prolyl oligopeptidase family serine peptidase [Pirellulales bacterium]
MLTRLLPVAVSFVAVAFVAYAALAAQPPQQARIPKPGIEVPAEKRAALEQKLGELRKAIETIEKGKDEGEIRNAIKGIEKGKDAQAKALLPDVRIYERAVGDALEFDEFFNVKELATADTLLDEGLQRARQLAEGKAPWTTATGLVVRGYKSRIDGSVQPFGLVIPPSYTAQTAGRYRLDIWFHGRGETLSEVNFLNEHRTKAGQFTPADTIVLHPYGRYCNAFKFAGEVDVFEALDAVRASYRVDENRISVRGFSMGGAATWHFAVHHADLWFAANPGAGFADTARYLKIFDSGEPEPPWYEQRLWRWYDCPPYCRNLYQCPTIAYSGEIDKQKAAADLMAAALAEYDIDLMHVIGPKTEHKYHPDAAKEVERRMTALARYGRDLAPLSVLFDTETLKYNRMHWVTIDGLEQHWERARIDADCTDDGVVIDTTNVTDLTLHFEPGDVPFDIMFPVNVSIDGDELVGDHPRSDRSWICRLHRENEHWKVGARSDDELHKRHNLQGPVDDAFMDAFVFVEPTGDEEHEAIGKWARSEFELAVESWRRIFRGRPRVKKDTEITDDDIATMNLVLWGSPRSNAVMKRIAEQLPIRWTDEQIEADGEQFAAEDHALVLIYPNPLNDERYVVLNSGFTFPYSANGSNAKQTPKLPDWAVINARTPRHEDAPGEVVAADFFGERWEVAPVRNRAKRQRVALSR